jgi:hypothetical protein
MLSQYAVSVVKAVHALVSPFQFALTQFYLFITNILSVILGVSSLGT